MDGGYFYMYESISVLLPQLRTFKKRYAELRNHLPTAAKIHSEEIAEKVPSKEQELQFIEVNTVVSVLKYYGSFKCMIVNTVQGCIRGGAH